MSPIAPFRSHRPGLAVPRTGVHLCVPVSDLRTRYEALAYLEAHDALSGDLHAFLAYKETDPAIGTWRVRIKSLQTAGGVFEPVTMVQQAQAAATRGASYFTWGYQLVPSPADPRQIEFRVHVLNRRPARLELYARLRQASGALGAPCAVVCDWP